MPARDDDRKDFRVEIDGDWPAAEMAVFLGDLAVLYEIRRSLDDLVPEPRGLIKEFAWWVRRGRYERSPHPLGIPWGYPWGWRIAEDGLDLVRIKYGSPGFVDLAGIGKVVEQLRLFIEKLIDLPAERRRRQLEDVEKAVDIEGKKIANAKEFLRLTEDARRLGISDEDVRYLIYEVDGAQERLLRQVERRLSGLLCVRRGWLVGVSRGFGFRSGS